jgi:hypothetical protein
LDIEAVKRKELIVSKKKPSLSDLTLAKGNKGTSPVPVTSASESQETDTTKRKGQTLRLEEGAWKQLKHLATDLGKPVHDLLIEAVNDLFKKYGKPPIAK